MQRLCLLFFLSLSHKKMEKAVSSLLHVVTLPNPSIFPISCILKRVESLLQLRNSNHEVEVRDICPRNVPAVQDRRMPSRIQDPLKSESEALPALPGI
jgi:hypothetical protein